MAGPVVHSINTVIAEMQAATQTAFTLQNVLKAIGNISIGSKTLTGNESAKDLVGLQKNVEEAITKKSNASTFGKINTFVSDKLYSTTLDDLYKKQDVITQALEKQTKLEEELNKKPAPKPKYSNATLDKFAGVSGGGGSAKKAKAPKKSGESARVKALKEATRAAEQLTKQYENQIKSTEKEIALRGSHTKLAETEYELFGKISTKAEHLTVPESDRNKLQKDRLLSLAAELDRLNRIEKQQAAIIEDAKAYGELRYQNKDLIRSDNIQSGYNDALARNKNALDAGTITTEQFKSEMKTLSEAYNSEFIDPAKSATDSLSTFAEQASRNMQDSFAQFLFDPFKNGIDGMLSGFVDMIKKMAAEQAASGIFDAINGGVKKAGGWGGMLSSAGSFISGLFHDGGIVGQGGGTIAVHPGVFAGAPRYHTGGIAGLKPDEIPAILQKGEGIISRKGMAQIGKSSSNSGGIQVNTTVSVQGSGSAGGDSPEKYRMLANQMNNLIEEFIARERRPGGKLA